MTSIVVWFTGLSGAGKTTICLALSDILKAWQIPCAVLDADVVRQQLCRDLGYSPADRRENLRRISREAVRLSETVPVVLVAAISPYRDSRAEVRSRHPNFLEVFVNAPVAICEARDPKGLYRRARAGLLPEFTGVSAPYERPLRPDVECRSDLETVAESSLRVLRAIEKTFAAATEVPSKADHWTPAHRETWPADQLNG